MLDLYDEFRRVIIALENAGVEYALCGGLAVAIHAVPRATVDIDLIVRDDVFARAELAVGSLGFTIGGTPMLFSRGKIEIRRLVKIEGEDHLMIDFLIAHDGLTREVLDGKILGDWEGHPLWTVTRSGLISLKRLRGSKQDEADIESLERADADHQTSARSVEEKA